VYSEDEKKDPVRVRGRRACMWTQRFTCHPVPFLWYVGGLQFLKGAYLGPQIELTVNPVFRPTIPALPMLGAPVAAPLQHA
jgi:hypothetical protein